MHFSAFHVFVMGQKEDKRWNECLTAWKMLQAKEVKDGIVSFQAFLDGYRKILLHKMLKWILYHVAPLSIQLF